MFEVAINFSSSFPILSKIFMKIGSSMQYGQGVQIKQRGITNMLFKDKIFELCSIYVLYCILCKTRICIHDTRHMSKRKCNDLLRRYQVSFTKNHNDQKILMKYF